MRGKELRVEACFAYNGITPAHAGKSYIFRYKREAVWDHPRTCGEKFRLISCGLLSIGSPPHMRGKAVAVSYVVHGFGITPAHAGKSIFSFLHRHRF